MPNVSRARFGTTLWLLGMPGVVVVAMTVVPQLLATVILPVPMWVAVSASLLQSGLLLALAAWVGTALAPEIGFGAPALEALMARRPLMGCFRKPAIAGVCCGFLGGICLFALGYVTPAELAARPNQFNISLLSRILYGGITEEILVRWFLTSAFAWLAWRVFQRRQGIPKPLYVWAAIGASAVLFAAGHLPAAAAMLGSLPPNVISFVIGGTAPFGMLFGYLFWRYGLEAAVLAHAITHIVAFILVMF